MAYYIKMENVNLYYPSTLYNATTLKQEVFSRLKLEKKKEYLEDVHALRDLIWKFMKGRGWEL